MSEVPLYSGGLSDCSKGEMLACRYKSANFGSEKRHKFLVGASFSKPQIAPILVAVAELKALSGRIL